MITILSFLILHLIKLIVIDIPIRLKMKDSLYNYAICDDEGNIVPFNIEKAAL